LLTLEDQFPFVKSTFSNVHFYLLLKIEVFVLESQGWSAASQLHFLCCPHRLINAGLISPWDSNHSSSWAQNGYARVLLWTWSESLGGPRTQHQASSGFHSLQDSLLVLDSSLSLSWHLKENGRTINSWVYTSNTL
jgi:hypothetical protein